MRQSYELHLPRHVVGVIPFAPVGEDGVNGQLVRLIHRGGVAEGEKAARDDTLFPVFPLADSSVERDRDTLPREGIRPSAGQQTSREARDRTADTKDIFQVLGVADLDRVPANRLFRVKRDPLPSRDMFQLDAFRLVAPKHVRGQRDALVSSPVSPRGTLGAHAQGGKAPQQRARLGRHLESALAFRVPVTDIFGVGIQAQRLVLSDRNADGTAVATREIITQRLAVTREQVERHGSGGGVGSVTPVEDHLYLHRVRVVVAQILVLAGCRGDKECRHCHCIQYIFHRLPPFFSL